MLQVEKPTPSTGLPCADTATRCVRRVLTQSGQSDGAASGRSHCAAACNDFLRPSRAVRPGSGWTTPTNASGGSTSPKGQSRRTVLSNDRKTSPACFGGRARGRAACLAGQIGDKIGAGRSPRKGWPGRAVTPSLLPASGIRPRTGSVSHEDRSARSPGAGTSPRAQAPRCASACQHTASTGAELVPDHAGIRRCRQWPSRTRSTERLEFLGDSQPRARSGCTGIRRPSGECGGRGPFVQAARCIRRRGP